MDAFRLFKRTAGGATLLFALAAAIAGCGSVPTSSASTSSISSTSATATACVALRPRTVAGTVQSVSNNTLTITDLQGKSVTATYSSTTRIQRQAAMDPGTLKEGGFVAVQVSKQPDNTYAATRIAITNRANNNFGNGQGGNGQQRRNNNANAACRPVRPANGGNGNGGNGANGNNANGARGVTGTIGQINGTALTVTEANGSDFTITLTKDTQITQVVPATSADLKTGVTLTLTGQADSKGTVAAQNITILLPGMLNNRSTTGG